MLYWQLPVGGRDVVLQLPVHWRDVILGDSGRRERCCSGSFRYAGDMSYWELQVDRRDVVLAASGRRERCCTGSFR